MLVCHGGAGHTAKDQPGVDKAADAGWNILSAGGTAVEAVVAAVQIMEDDPLLNAGTGGRTRADGSVQLDAAIATSDGRPRGRVGDTPLWGPGLWVDQNVAIAATGIGEEITLKMLCHRVAIHPGSLHEKLQHGLSLFDPSIEVGLIGISVDGEGLGLANTEMPWAIRSANQ